MPTSFIESLQATLGDAYRIERELAPGGMSRVFLATEASLNRAVVIKVLPAELANEVSAARFKREIEVTAHLQHPHILPVLAAGARDGLLWYAMPYVEGESLRHRLTRERQLPIADAARLLDEVGDALAFAHSRGVVHRDIKPENILLQEGHAVLADFGIARALLQARTGDQLTATGLGLGTPGYMAPEQAAGESQVDARADLYALGAVGYEMLAGLPPFTGPSAQAVIAAHLTTPPRPLRELRPDVPADLAAAVMRALAKSPDERFQTAPEFRAAVRMRERPAALRRSRTMVLATAVAVVFVAGIAAALAYRARAARPLDADLLAVAPFDVLDPSLQLWHEGMVDLLSRNLDAGGSLRTVSPSTVIRGWSGRADNESATTLGRRTGARLALIGTMLGAGRDSVQIDATVFDVAAGRSLGQFTFRAAPDHVARLADSVSVAVWRLLGQTGRADLPPRVGSLGTTSLPAMKAFLRGEQFYRKSAWDSSIVYFEQAAALDSGFALAYSRVGAAKGWKGGAGDPTGIRSRLRAGALNHGLSPRDSMVMLSDSIEASLQTGGPRAADAPARTRRELAMLEAAAQRYGDDAEIRYRLGDAYYHNGIGETSVDFVRVLSTFDQAIALDSAFAPSYLHPAELALRVARDRERSVRYLRAYLAHADTTGRASYMGVMAALLDRATLDDRAIDSVLTAFPASSVDGAMQQLALFPDTGETAVRLGRAMLARSRRAGAAPLSYAGQRRIEFALSFRGHVREAAALGGEVHTSNAADMRMVGPVPGPTNRELLDRWIHEWSAQEGQPYFLLLLPALASEGDTASIGRIFHLTDGLLKSPNPNFVSWATDARIAMNAYLALARRDSAAALRGFESVAANRCVVLCRVEPLVTARLLAARGRLTEADSVLSRRWIVEGGPLPVLYALERGRIAERLGNRAEAIEAYALVSDAWAKADPELQPTVAEARQALRRLRSDASVATTVTKVGAPRP